MICAYLDKRRQFFIRVHNETLTVVAVRSAIQIVRPLESIAETRPQLQPALLRLSAMIPNTSRFLIRLAGSHQHLRKR